MTRLWLAIALCALFALIPSAFGSCSVALNQESVEATPPNGGLVLLSVAGCSISTISASILQLPSISFNAQGSNSLGALVTAAGQYSISVNENGVSVSGSPFSVEVTAGPAVASNTVFLGSGMTLAVAGQSSTIFIVPKDNFGNNASVASLTAVMAEISSSATADVVSSGGQLTFSATRSGTYRLSVILGSIASTLSVPVAPAEADSSTTVLENPLIATAGASRSFNILMRDKFGNLCVSPGSLSLRFSLRGISSTFGGDISTDAVIHTSYNYVSGAVYSVTFSTTRAGFYQINSIIEGRSGNAVLSGQVVNTAGCASLSFVTSFPQTAVAGTSFSAVIQMVDEYGNQATQGTGSYKGYVGNLLCVDCQSVYTGGKVSIQFALTASATYSASVKVGDSLVSGFPHEIFVSPIISGSPSSAVYSVSAPDVVAGGNPQIVSFVLLDRFGNVRREASEHRPQLSASLSGSGAASILPSAVINLGGVYTVTVNASSAFTVSGAYRASVHYASSPLSSDGPSWNVQPSAPAAIFSSKSGKGAFYALVSTLTTFSLTLKDKYANTITQSGHSADVALSSPFLFSVSDGPSGSGTIIVSYSTNASGSVKMSCTVLGSDVIGSPSEVYIQAVGFSASRSSFLTNGVSAVAGTSFSIDLAVADTDGNFWIVNPYSDSSDGNIVADVKISGPSSFAPVTLRGPPGSTIFRVSALFTRSGQYSISADIVYTKPAQNGETLTLSGSTAPQPFVVDASGAVKNGLYIDGAGSSIGTAGLYSQFFVHTFDTFGNLRTNYSNALGNNFLVAADVQAVSLSGEAITASIPGIRGQADGTYAVIYRYTLIGHYKFSVRFQGELTSVSTVALLVPGFACGSSSKAVLSSTIVTAGSPTMFVVSATDSYGNARSTSGGGTLTVSIPNVPSAVYQYSTAETAIGAYEVAFIITRSGVFPVNMFLNDSPLSGNPFQITVVPSFADPVYSTLVLPSIYAVTAGIPALFDVSSRDRFSNVKSVGDEVFSVSAIRMASSHFEHESTPKLFNGTCIFSNELRSYTVRLSLTVAGNYSVSVKVGLSSTDIKASPFQLVVSPNVLCASLSIASGQGLTLVTSGISSSFTITARDTYGNDLSQSVSPVNAVISGSSISNFIAASRYLNAGKFISSFTATVSGTFSLAISLVFGSIRFSPIPVRVVPAIACAGKSVVFGNMLTLSTAGSTTRFSICAKDQFSNSLTASTPSFVAVATSSLVSVPLDVLASSGCEHALTYAPTVAGAYSIAITLVRDNSININQSVRNSPFSATVLAAASFPSSSRISNVPSAVAGVKAVISIRGHDIFSNLRSSGSDQLSVSITNPQSTVNVLTTVTDFGNGVYDASFMCTFSGTFSIIASMQTPSGLSGLLSNSGVSLVISPNIVCASTSVYAGFSAVTAGVSSHFSIFARDRYGNSRPGNSSVASLFTTGAQSIVNHLSGNLYTFIPAITASGTFSVFIKYESLPIMSSPLSLIVLPGFVSASASLVSISSTVVLAGSSLSFRISSRDSFGNFRTLPDASFDVKATSSFVLSDARRSTSGGVYSFELSMTVASSYQLSITLNGSAVASSPYNVRVDPSVAEISRCVLIGNRFGAATAGKAIDFVIQVNDLYSNRITLATADNVLLFIVQVVSPKVSFLAARPTRSAEALYEGRFVTTISATYSVSISYRGQHISNSPFSVDILPNLVCRTRSYVTTTVLRLATAGMLTDFSIIALDQYSNQLSNGGLTFLASISPISANPVPLPMNVTDTNDGSYAVSFIVTATGQYSSSVSMCLVDGCSDLGKFPNKSPFRTTVIPGAMRSSASFLTGEGVTAATAAVDANFFISLNDASGNFVGVRSVGLLAVGFASEFASNTVKTILQIHFTDSKGNSFSVMDKSSALLTSGKTAASAVGLVRNEADGTVRVMYNLKVFGALQMQVLLNGHHVKGSPFNVSVFPLDLIPNPAKSSLSSSSLPAAIAGFPGSVSLIVRNKFGVGMISGNTIAQVFSSLTSNSISVLVKQIGVSSSLINIGYLATVAGIYKFSIRIGSTESSAQHISGSPFTLVVFPSFSNVEGSIARSEKVKIVVAGSTANITIEARDQFSNLQDPSKPADSFSCIFTRAQETQTAVRIEGPFYQGQFMATLSGSYEVDVILFGSSIVGSPFAVQVLPSTLAVQNSVITRYPPHAIAGSRALLSISARDAFGNRLSAADMRFELSSANPAVPLPGPTLVSQSYIGSGEYNVIFVATVAEVYAMALTIPAGVIQPPFQTVVSPTLASERFTQNLTALARSVVAGHSETWRIFSRDSYDNAHTSSQAGFLLEFSGPTSGIFPFSDLKDGTYEQTSVFTSSGIYSLSVMINSSRSHIAGSPFSIIVSSDSVFALSCPSFGAGLFQAGSGASSSFSIFSFDKFGNKIKRGGASFLATLQLGSSITSATVQDQGDGSYDVNYVVTASATYSLKILLNGNHTAGSPFNVTVSPHPACVPRLSRQFGSIIPSAENPNPFGITGDSSFWTIQTLDKFGNNRTTGGDFVAVSFAGPSFFNADVQDLGNGQYLVVAVINAAGSYTVSSRISGQHISGSPLRGVQFAAAGAGYDSIITSGNGVSSAIAGTKLEVFIDASAPAAQKVIGSNKFRVKFVYKPTGTSLQPTISTVLPSGSHYVQSILTHAGAYRVDVRGELDFRSVANSPFALSLTHGELSPSACDAIGSGSVGGVSSSVINAFVRLRDQYGNVISNGATAEVTATLSTGGAVGVVQILANDMQFPDFVGFYKVTYIVPAGASSLSIFVSNIHISGSPFSISGVSSSGSVDAKKSSFVGYDLSRPVPASRACTFSLYFRDSAGMNVQQFDSSLLAVSATAESQIVRASLVASFSNFAVLSLAITKVSRSSGGWLLTASYNGQRIETSDRFHIFALDVSPPHSIATSSDQNCSPAGCQARDFFNWEVQATDMYQNVISQSLGSNAVSISVGMGTSSVTSAILDNQDGSYSMQYTGTVAGIYSVSIIINSAHILGSPFSTKVLAAAPSSSDSFLTGSALLTMTAGKGSSLFVNVRDSFGNMYDRQLFNLNARFGSQDLSSGVAYTSDGTYETVFSVTFSSTYSLSVAFSPDPLSAAAPVGKPISVDVLPALMDPSNTLTSGPGLNTFRAGESLPVYLSAYDAFGNIRSSSLYVDVFSLSFSSSSNQYSAEAVASVEGSYVYNHASTIAGNYVIGISNQATAVAIARSPFLVQVLPGAASHEKSTLSPTASIKKKMIAGNLMQFAVDARDKFGSLTGCGSTFFVSSHASGQSESVSVSSSSCSEGVYYSSISPTAAGSLQVNILMQGSPIIDAPFIVIVSAGPVDPSRCVATGTGLLSAISGTQSSIGIQTSDSFGNKCYFDPFGEVISFVVSFVPSGSFSGPCIRGDTNDAHVAYETGTHLCVDSSVVNNEDSTYTIYYTPWYASTYDISVTMNSIGIMNSPFGGLKVLPASAYAQNFNVSSSSAISSGSVFGASVLIRDNVYNSISSSLIAPEATLLRYPVYNEDESALQSFPVPMTSTSGVFQGTLLLTRAATYSLSVSFNKVLAGSGTIPVVVSPGAVYIAACTLAGNIGGGHVSGPSTFLIIARDVNGNQVSTGGDSFSISISALDGGNIVWTSDAAGQPVDNSDGTYSVTYTVSRRGTYSVAVTSGSISVAGSPMAVTFVDDSDTSASFPVAARSKPFGDGLYSAVVNVPSVFQLRLANIRNMYMWTGSFKDNLIVTMNLEFSNLFVPVAITETSSSLISFSYTISTVGAYTLSITLFGDNVIGSPYRVVAIPSTTVSSMTLVSSNAAVSGTAGSLRTFSISPRDASGNLQSLDPFSGPENFAAIASLQGSTSFLIHASLSVQDDGFQIASWTPTVAGFYALNVMHGPNVVKSLPSISIGPGAVAAATTVVSGAGIGKVFVGSLVVVDIIARDAFGNVISDGLQTFRFVVSSDGRSIASGNAQWNQLLGRFQVSYLASVIGPLQVALLLVSGTDLLSVPGSPFVAESLVGPSCASLSVLSFFGSQMVAGQILQFKVVTADDFGNPVSVGGNFFRVTVSARSLSFSPAVIDNLDGTYSTSFQLTSAGNVTITAVRNGFHLSGSPFSSAVLPGLASGPMSMISVSTPSLIAGGPFIFSVSSLDRFGNALSTGGSVVAATLTAVSTGVVLSVPVIDRLDGTYSGSMPIFLTGTYNFGATLSNIPIQSGASFSILVTASSLDYARSSFSLSIDLVTADNSFDASLSPVDAYGNQASFNGEELSVHIHGGSSIVSYALIYQSASAVFSATLSISKTGAYSVRALLARSSGGSVSVGSSANISVIPGADAPENGRLVNVPANVLIAGEFSSWVLQSMDKFNNPVDESDDAFTCALVCKTGCGIATVPGVSLSHGRKLFNITGSIAGDYLVHITLGSRHIIGSPFNVVFIPAAVSAQKSSVSGFALRHAFPGQPTRFQVNLRDCFANAIKNPSFYNALQISGAASFAVNFDETCSCAFVSYSPPAASSFTLTVSYESMVLSTSTIAVNNNPQGKFRVLSATGYASPATSSATGNGLIFATAGKAATFSVIVKDGSHNLLSASVVAALGTSSTSFSKTQLSTGSLSLSYVATFSGVFPLSVRLDSGAHIIGSPFTVFIEPSSPSAALSMVTGAPSALAGTIYTASLTCVDEFGNLVGVGGFSNISGSLVGSSYVPGKVIDKFTGSATFQFPVVELGVYRVSVVVQGVLITNTILVEVQPGVVASAPSVLLPLAASSVVGGDNVEFFVEPRDKFGNVVAIGPPFLGRLKGRSATSLVEMVKSSQLFSAGLHNLKFNVTVSGQYSFAVSYLSSAIQNSPLLFEVVPSTVSQRHSVVAGLGTVLSVKGSQSSFSVTLRDSFSNVLTDASLYRQIGASLVSRGSENSVGIIQHNSAGDISVTALAVFFSAGTFGYTLPMDGRFMLDVKFDGVHLAGSPFTVKSLSAPSPRIISSMFTDTVSGITIQFDVPTNQASMNLPGPCSQVFIPETIAFLAANPVDSKCSWSSPTVLNVFLGFGATLVAGQRVSFASGAITVQKSEYPVGSGHFFISSDPVSVSVAIDRPKNPPAPIPIIKAPSMASSCDVVVLDASSSAGSGGRPLQFMWGSLPASINDFDIRSFMRGFVNKPVATLPALLLPGGYTFSFMVRVTNFLDVSTDALVSIQKVEASLPTVVIEGGITRSVDSSSVLRIKAQVQPSVCGSTSGFTFEWRWLSVSPSGPLPVLDSETVATPQLYIEKNSLIPGRTYVLGFFASPTGSNSSAGSSQVTITAKPAPLLAIIDGSHRVVSGMDDIILDGSRSIDFDHFSTSNFSFAWSCLVGGLPCFPSAASLFEQDVDTLRIPFSHLSPGSYIFHLTVSKDVRSHSVSASITVTRGSPTRVGISPITKAKLNSDDKITLQSISYEPSGAVVSFEWSQISGENVLYVSSTNQSRDVDRIRTALDAPMLVFSPFALQPGQSYGFRLTGVTSGQQLGVAEIFFQINAPPSSGSFTVTPTSGRALTDLFSLQCTYWEDSPEDLPLKYEFRYLIMGSEDEIPILSTDKNTYETVMPLAAAGPLTRVIAYIFDSWGASSRAQRTLSISVPVGGRRLMASQAETLKQSIASALAVGSCEDFLGSLSALASLPGASVCPYAASMKVCSAKPPASAITTALHSVKSLIDAAQGSCSKEQESAMVSVMTSLSASASAAGNGISSLGAKSMVGALGSMVGGGSGSSEGSKVSDSVGSLADALTSNQVVGEDSSQINSASLALQANKASASELNSKNAVLGCTSPGAAVFTTPPGMLNVVDGASVSAVAAAYTTSPFASSRNIGSGVSSLAFSDGGGGSVPVDGLAAPIVLMMPLTAAPSGNSSRRRLLMAAGDGTVETCRYFNHKKVPIPDWDGEGCIAVGFETGQLVCHCFHLTEFGSASDQVVPEMNTPDPVGDAKLFTQINMSNALALIFVSCLFFTYCVSMWVGWRADKRETDAKLNPTEGASAQAGSASEANVNDVLNSGDFLMMKRLFRGNMAQKLQLLRQKFFDLVSQEHLFLSCIWKPRNSVYTRPRRITVLFCIIIGNMAVGGLFAGAGQTTILQTIMAGVISSLLMFPPSFIFAYLFRNIGLDRRAALAVSQDNKRQQEGTRAAISDSLNLENKGDSTVLPPPEFMRTARAPRPKDLMPSPDVPAFRGVAPASSRLDFGKNEYRRVAATSLELDAEVQEGGTGTYIPRRALPISPTSTPTANPHVAPARFTPAVTRSKEPAHSGDREMHAMAEAADTSKDPLGEATGIMRIVYKGSEAALRAISTRQSAGKRQQPLPSPMAIVAYTMAALWMLIAMYFSIIFGLKFPSAQSRSWVMAFGISLIQDMVVQQSIRVAAKTTISLVVMPRIAAFLAGRILNAYKKPQSTIRKPDAAAAD